MDLEDWTLEDHRIYYLRDARAYRRCMAHLGRRPELWDLTAPELAAELERIPRVGPAAAFAFVTMLHYERAVIEAAGLTGDQAPDE